MDFKVILLSFVVLFTTLCGCSTWQINSKDSSNNLSREISSITQSSLVTPTRADWNFVSMNLNLKGLIYTPFFVDGQKLTLYSGGYGGGKTNRALKLEIDLSKSPPTSTKKIAIKEGPSFPYYGYFHAPRVARNGNELWMLIEVAGCYNGCNDEAPPKRLAVYRSMNNGNDWTFLDFVHVDGKKYVDQWNAHTGLIYNPNGNSKIDLTQLANNRFITIGENKDLLVSADGIHYQSVTINHPFPKDRFIFASLVKTPYGFHLTSSANWSDRYFTTTVRHLFSKDLINWYALESHSFLRNPTFYKGVHLSYDEKTDKLWAISPCKNDDQCSIVAWMKAKDFLVPSQEPADSSSIPIGEYVHIDGKTALIISKKIIDTKELYNVRFSDGTFKNDYSPEMIARPLSGYQKEGCLDGFQNNKVCVGDTIYVYNKVASIIGIKKSLLNTKYALKFANGEVGINYYSWAFSLP